jgi:hypothetical protein
VAPAERQRFTNHHERDGDIERTEHDAQRGQMQEQCDGGAECDEREEERAEDRDAVMVA